MLCNSHFKFYSTASSFSKFILFHYRNAPTSIIHRNRINSTYFISKHPAEGLDDLIADDGEIGKQEAYQHNEGENPDFGRYLLRLTLESLQLQHLKIVSEHLKIDCAVIAAQYTNESAHYIRELR